MKQNERFGNKNLQQIPFEKYHGNGNDFIFIDARNVITQFSRWDDLKSFVEHICNRNFSVGADGVIFVNSSHSASCATSHAASQSASHAASHNNFHNTSHVTQTSTSQNGIQILIINSDGSFASTCGNALRCLGLKLLRDKIWDGKSEFGVRRYVPKLAGDSGDPELQESNKSSERNSSQRNSDKQDNSDKLFATLLGAENFRDKETAAEVTVGMGVAKSVRLTPLVEGALQDFGRDVSLLTPVFVQLENPHWVFVSPDFASFQMQDFIAFGKFAQNELRRKVNGNKDIPACNISAVTLNQKNSPAWNLTVFERGAGLTLCCGSGSVATRIALEEMGLVQQSEQEVVLKMPGGPVSVSLPLPTHQNQRSLKGAAVFAFHGVL